MSKLLKDSVITTLAEGSGAIITLVNSVLLARAMGADGKGAFTLAVAVSAWGALIFGMRWQRPLGFFVAREPEQMPGLLGTILLMMCVATGMGFATWYVVPWLFTDYVLGNMEPAIIPLALGTIATRVLWQTISGLFGGLRDFRTRTMFLMSSSVKEVIVVVTLFSLGYHTVFTYLAWQVATSALLFTGWLAHFMISRHIVPTLDFRLFGRMLRYSSMTLLSVMLDTVTIQLDIFLLNSIMQDTSAVGVYSTAVGLTNQMGRMPTILGTVMFSHASANEIGEGEQTARAVRLAFVAMVAMSLVVALLGTYLIVPLFGPDFAGSVEVLYVMLPATMFLGLFRMLGSDIDGRGRPGLTSICSFLAAATIVSLDLVWIPSHGIMGAAWASLAAYAVACTASALMFCHSAHQPVIGSFTPRISDIRQLSASLSRIIGNRLKRAAG